MNVIPAIVFSCLLTCVPARAALLSSEPFSYGASNATLAGLNGGTGFSAAWTGGTQFGYESAGLSLGNLPVSGGKMAATLVSEAGALTAFRGLSTTLSGTTYGSFLVNVGGRPVANTVQGVLLGRTGDTDNTSAVALQADEYAFDVPAIRHEGASTNFGTALTLGQTYMLAYRTDLGSASQATTLWIMTAAQYDAQLAAGGLNEANFNSLAVGTASNQIWARGTATRNAALDAPVNALGVLSYVVGNTVTTYYDEFRLATDFASAVPTPEASTLSLGVFGLALVVRRRR